MYLYTSDQYTRTKGWLKVWLAKEARFLITYSWSQGPTQYSNINITHLLKCGVAVPSAELSHYLLTAYWMWFLQLWWRHHRWLHCLCFSSTCEELHVFDLHTLESVMNAEQSVQGVVITPPNSPGSPWLLWQCLDQWLEWPGSNLGCEVQQLLCCNNNRK